MKCRLCHLALRAVLSVGMGPYAAPAQRPALDQFAQARPNALNIPIFDFETELQKERGDALTFEAPKGDAAVTRARILLVAKQVFSRRGYSECGIRDIAGELGLSATILLRYYGSKAGLFEFNLGQLLTDFVGCVQIVTDFKDHGGAVRSKESE